MKRNKFMDTEKVKQELNDFKKHLVLQYSLREITINEHIGNIKRMINIIQTTNPEKEEVINYVYELKQSNKSNSHISNNIQSVEKYMDFKHNLLRFAKPRRDKKLIVDILTEGEINRLIQATKNIKEKAMITLLVFSGVRNRSFCNIKLRDVDFGDNTIRVRKVKGRKEYMSNISSDCIRILLSYLEKYPRKLDDFLFTTKVKGNQYSTSDIRKFVKVLGKRAKIEKKIYVHLLRHSLASNMLNRGASIILIKEQLGHDWIQSTENYLSSLPSRIKSEYEIYKPSYI